MLAGRVPHEQVPRLLAEAHVLCQPSLLEPLGQSLLEAMACGRVSQPFPLVRRATFCGASLCVSGFGEGSGAADAQNLQSAHWLLICVIKIV